MRLDQQNVHDVAANRRSGPSLNIAGLAGLSFRWIFVNESRYKE